MRSYYRYAGLRIASEIPLPEWSVFEEQNPGNGADVCITLGSVREDDLIGIENGRLVAPGECRFLVPGVGSFHVREGREIRVSSAPGISMARLRPWLLGSAWAALCYQRGLFLVHASAVEVKGAAVLFCARSRGGKSTLAARLHQHGHRLLSDDFCHLDIPPEGAASLLPAPPRIKLWDDALAQLKWNLHSVEPDHARAGKFSLAPMAPGPLEPLPVREIHLLEWGNLGITRVSGMLALLRFLPAATYRAKLLEPVEQLPRHSNLSMKLLRHVPVWELRRPRDLSAIDEVASLLAKHWSV